MWKSSKFWKAKVVKWFWWCWVQKSSFPFQALSILLHFCCNGNTLRRVGWNSWKLVFELHSYSKLQTIGYQFCWLNKWKQLVPPGCIYGHWNRWRKAWKLACAWKELKSQKKPAWNKHKLHRRKFHSKISMLVRSINRKIFSLYNGIH